MGSPDGFDDGHARVGRLSSGRALAAYRVIYSGGAVVPVINLTAVSLNSMTGEGTVDHQFEV